MVVDLCAGPGGWDLAAARLGLAPLGIEWDEAACATRAAAGLATLRADVAELDPRDFAVEGLIASPPCQGFSRAGKQRGRHDREFVLEGVDVLLRGEDPRGRFDWHDPRSPLVLEPLRWALATLPRWVACEQVPAVLPLWERMAEALQAVGYATWTGKLRAEQYGVPQTRERAFLLARWGAFEVRPPEATHSRYYERDPGRLDLGVAPWVSMAEALGWADAPRAWARNRPAPTVGCTIGGVGGKQVGGHINLEVQEAAALQAFPAMLSTDRRAPDWPWRRPATTIACDPRMFPPGGHHANDGRRTDPVLHSRSRDAIRVGAKGVAALQSFPDGYPWQGTKSKVFEQIGNAVPPLMALHVLRAVADVEVDEREAA